jgi:hypothetical protein
MMSGESIIGAARHVTSTMVVVRTWLQRHPGRLACLLRRAGHVRENQVSTSHDTSTPECST